MKKTRLVYRVPYADTDKMQVVYYANYFVYFERVRNEMLRESGLTYSQMEKRGLLLPVVEAHCVYRLPAVYDDLVDIVGWFETGTATRIRIVCEIIREKKLLATGYTIHACLSSNTMKAIAIPEDVRERLIKS